MKAAVLYACGQPLRVVDGIKVPPPGPGQVHVKLAFSGVCRSQLMEVQGGRGADPYLPHLLGHEGSGTVLAVGEGVKKVVPGDRVVLGWIKGEGLNAPGPKYMLDGKPINAGAVTTFNTEAVVAENRCVGLPDGVPLDIATLFGCAVPTGAGMAMNEILVAPGSHAVVFGLGGIGMIAVMALKAMNCASIIAVDIEQGRLAAARELGATATVDAKAKDPVAEVHRLTNGLGADYAIDAAGQVRTIEQAFDSVRKFGGQCVFASHPESGQRLSLDPHDLISGKIIKGSWGGGSRPDIDVPRFAELYRAGKLPLEHLVGRRYTLDEVNVALGDLSAGRVMRPLIDFGAA